MSARTISLTETEQLITKEAMHLLRTNNQLLSQIATELDLSMNTCAEAARGVMTKLTGNNTRHLVERATRR